MDMTTCVARRTRSRTESYLNLILNRSKGITIEDESEGVCSPSSVKAKRRRRRSREEDDDVEYLGSNLPEEGKGEDVANLRGEEEISNLNHLSPDDDDDVVFVGIVPRENEHVEVEDDNVGSSPVISPRVCDSLLDDLNLRDEEKISESDDVISLSLNSDEEPETGSSEEVSGGEDRDSGDSDEDGDDSDSSDYMEESTESSFVESSDSDFVCSEDEEGGANDIAKGKKSSSEKVYNHEKSPTSRCKNNLNVFKLLAKSIWEDTDVFEEDICSGDEIAEVDSREDAIIREMSSKKVNEQMERRKSRRFRRVKEKNHLKGESFDGRDGQETIDCTTEDSPPINLRFGCDEPVLIEETEEEKEINSLWEEMALALTLEGMHSSTPAKKGDMLCSKGTHNFVLDEEIGLKCCHCSYVAVEVKDVSPAMDKYRANVNGNKKCSDKKSDPSLTRLEFDALDHISSDAPMDNTEGTVWQFVPGIKDTLFPHQQEGFEFIWKNLAGTTKVDEFKSLRVKESGGCIISHAPGTGKTRLTIVFLQSYLKRFPNSQPVVIAPAHLLLTWEEEFRKWNADIPFYNMNTRKFSGYEDPSAVSLIKGNKQHKNNKLSIRMAKIYSWCNQKSILGVSYPLYEKLAKNKYTGEMQEFRRMLLELPGLLVLDEGHTPRNQNSCIYKVLTEVRTEKRIILSGTLFQNNFKELSNVLSLARPAYTDKITSRLQELSKWSQEGKHGRFNEEVGIVKLKAMIAPFVHVHEGSSLQESLPGLRDCVVVLNPPFQQKKILDRIDSSQTTFELEHKLSAVSVHPSLYLCCNPTKKERLVISPATLRTLEECRLDSKEGVKTRFLINFIRFSETVKEKVLVFSQYIETLKLIKDQLRAVFGWTEGEEVLFMDGKVEQKGRQHLINNFNKPDSKSKVLLASTKACSEGINLVGASRVVLLDVVWNPSVERQAISRAYRIGQKRVVFTYHLMSCTSEWDKYCKQTKKHRMSQLVFSTNEKDKLIKNEVVSEDRILDEMVRHEKLRDMFEKIIYHPKESHMFPNIL